MKDKLKRHIKQYDKGDLSREELTKEILALFDWVDFSNKEPDEDGVYYVYPNKHHHVAEYHKWGQWGGKWSVDDTNGYECVVEVSHWKKITAPDSKKNYHH